MKDKTIKYLARRLMDEGVISAETLPGAKVVLAYWMKTGKLKLRQRPSSGWNVVNDQEIEEIIKAFGVGGEGYWHAES